MHRLHTILSKVIHPLRERTKFLKQHGAGARLADIAFIAIMVFTFLSLIALMWYQLRPIRTVDIKVPVATDRSTYAPGEEIGGIFFGEVFYEGEVRVLREVYCSGYKGLIDPPENARNGDFYDTQSIPRKLDGLSVNIGHLPADIPVGKNCVLQFTNVYEISTPFGTRRIEYRYYTQNFSIISQERRDLLECEASGRKDCNEPDVIIQQVPVSHGEQSTPETPQTTPEATQPTQPAQRAEPQTERPSEPVTPPQSCRINFLGIKLFCR